MSRYSDCYPGCGGEDCPCCEIHIDHMNNYGRDQFEPDFDPNDYEDEEAAELLEDLMP